MKLLEQFMLLYYEINNIYLELYNLELAGKKISKAILDKINELSNDKNIVSVGIVSSYIENRKRDKSRVKKLSAGFVPE